ncbi:MAG: hypothetical protein ACP5OA_03400 [Candidatus Woesearchaeota archaeon]
MRKIEFRLGKHVYQKFIRLTGAVIYMKDGRCIDEHEFAAAEALIGLVIKPMLPQSDEDLMWAIHNHIKVAYN